MGGCVPLLLAVRPDPCPTSRLWGTMMNPDRGTKRRPALASRTRNSALVSPTPPCPRPLRGWRVTHPPISVRVVLREARASEDARGKSQVGKQKQNPTHTEKPHRRLKKENHAQRRMSPSDGWLPGEIWGAAAARADGSPKALILHVRLMPPQGPTRALGAEPPGNCRSRDPDKDTPVPTWGHTTDTTQRKGQVRHTHPREGQVEEKQQNTPERGDPNKVSFLSGINKWLLLLLKE